MAKKAARKLTDKTKVYRVRTLYDTMYRNSDSFEGIWVSNVVYTVGAILNDSFIYLYRPLTNDEITFLELVVEGFTTRKWIWQYIRINPDVPYRVPGVPDFVYTEYEHYSDFG